MYDIRISTKLRVFVLILILIIGAMPIFILFYFENLPPVFVLFFILAQDGRVSVDLDDGDEREVGLEAVRLLPPDYPLVQGKGEPQIPLGEVEGDSLVKLTVQVESLIISAPKSGRRSAS